MKATIFILAVSLLLPLASSAQLLSPNPAGVSLGPLHTTVRDVEATKNFWILLGATPIKIDGSDAMKVSGSLIFLAPGSPPEGGNRGTTMEHLGVTVRNGADVIAKLKAAGVKVALREGRTPYSVNIATPDGLGIEMESAEEESAGTPPAITVDHLHYRVPEAVRPEVQAWYVNLFGAKPLSENNRGQTLAGDIPGTRLRFSVSRETPTATKGKALDRIGFEVKNLEALCKKLETAGVKFIQPFSKTRHQSYASAEIADPWGTHIELTEGLNKF